MRKMWNHAIDLKKRFIPRKRIIYIYSTVKVTTDCTSILCRKEE